MNEQQEITDYHYSIRRRYIFKCIQAGNTIRVQEIANKFKCSTTTVRKDLRFLGELGIEIHTKKGYITSGELYRVNIVREIKFPSNYKDAGVSILSYFSKVLEEKYPDTDATVVITQHGDTVILKVETEEGELERIEETLEEYGKVVSGQITPKQLFPNTIASIELKNKLELVSMELRLKEETFKTLNSTQSQRILSLETQVSELRTLIGNQLNTVQSLAQALTEISNKNNITESISVAIKTISKIALKEYSSKNEEELRNALAKIKKENHSVFLQIKDSLLSITNSVAANMITPWVMNVIKAFPK